MVNIRQMLVSSSKYGVKCPYSMTPQGITVHNTANDASANNEVSYMINNNYETSFHYAVDDIEIVQGIPLDRNAWHASDGGSGFGNRNTIAIEICYSKSGGDRFDKAEENAVDLIVYLLKKYGWGIEKVKRHYDYATNKKYCPHRTMDKGWNRFLKMVEDKLNPQIPTPTPTPTVIYRIRKTWADAKSQIGAYSNLDNAKANCPEGYSVFDPNGNCVYTKAEKVTVIYRIRKTWADAKSQIGAYSNLNNAKTNCPEGYSVFDPNGNCVYTREVVVKKIYRVKDSNGVQLGAYSNLDNAKKLASEKKAIVYDENNVVVVSYVVVSDEVSRYSENGVFYPNTTINFRNEPNLNSPIQGQYYSGESVKYDLVVIGRKYNWISWVSASSGVRRYMPIRDKVTGEKWGYAI